jgi:hypothetical protein
MLQSHPWAIKKAFVGIEFLKSHQPPGDRPEIEDKYPQDKRHRHQI